MLATGDERFKEKMDLDMQVAKLKVLKQSYLSEHYDLEDRILKHYPQEIKGYEERITGYGNDAEIASQHKPQGEDKFCPMTLNGVTYKRKSGRRRDAACHLQGKPAVTADTNRQLPWLSRWRFSMIPSMPTIV